MRRLAIIGGLMLLAGLLVSAAWAQDTDGVQFITEYHLARDGQPVYGLFDLGNKPSIKIPFPTLHGGVLRFTVHGRHYHSPNPRPFTVWASFEDITGRVFDQSPPVTVTPATFPTKPLWFAELEEVAGLYGSQAIEITVPAGTSVVNVLGDDGQTAVSPNQLVGYLSQIILPPATADAP